MKLPSPAADRATPKTFEEARLMAQDRVRSEILTHIGAMIGEGVSVRREYNGQFGVEDYLAVFEGDTFRWTVPDAEWSMSQVVGWLRSEFVDAALEYFTGPRRAAR